MQLEPYDPEPMAMYGEGLLTHTEAHNVYRLQCRVLFLESLVHAVPWQARQHFADGAHTTMSETLMPESANPRDDEDADDAFISSVTGNDLRLLPSSLAHVNTPFDANEPFAAVEVCLRITDDEVAATRSQGSRNKCTQPTASTPMASHPSGMDFLGSDDDGTLTVLAAQVAASNNSIAELLDEAKEQIAATNVLLGDLAAANARIAELEAADAERVRIRSAHSGSGGWLPRYCEVAALVYQERFVDAHKVVVSHLKRMDAMWKEPCIRRLFAPRH